MHSEATPQPERGILPRLRTWLVLGNGVIAAVLLGLVVQGQAGILHREREDERSRVLGLARSLSQTIQGEMDLVDMGLQSVTQQLQAMKSKPERLRAEQVNAMVAAQLSLMPFLEGLMITDALGIVRYGDPMDPGQVIDVRERAHFQQARAQHKAALVISEAVVSQSTPHQRVFAARRLEHSDGSFAGIVSGTIRPQRFQRIFSAVELGDKGVISLRNEARQTLARVAGGKSQDTWFGNAETSPELAHAFSSLEASSSFLSTARQDGIERISAFQRVNGYPLAVIVGEGTDSFVLPWRAQVERIALLLSLIHI